MTTTPPPVVSQGISIDQDAEHLRLLHIFWYIVAGLQALGACFLLLYIAIGICLAAVGIAAGTAAGGASHDPSNAMIGLPFAGMGILITLFFGFLLLLFAAMAFLHYKVGQSLMQRKNITLCYVMAAIVCLSVPVGTVLGIFTFIVLSRPSVKASFT